MALFNLLQIGSIQSEESTRIPDSEESVSNDEV